MRSQALDYGDVEAEWAALDRGAGMAWLDPRCSIVVSGDDRVEFLQGQLANDIAALADGQGCASALLTAKGRVAGIVAVYRAGEVFELVVEQCNLESCRRRLEQFLVAEDVELELAPAARSLWLAGPQAAKVLKAAALDSKRPSGWGRSRGEIDGHALTIRSRGDELRVATLQIDVGEEGAPALWDRLAAAGAVPVGATAYETLRVESGRAAYGVDVDESRIAIEARLHWAIHFSKGCYVGQEVIERGVSRGRINHLLCLLASDSEVAVGAHIHGGGERDVVTSALRSPGRGPLCLAYVDAERADTGTELLIDTASGAVPARILEWPRQDG